MSLLGYIMMAMLWFGTIGWLHYHWRTVAVIFMLMTSLMNLKTAPAMLLTEFEEVLGVIQDARLRDGKCVRTPCISAVIIYSYTVDNIAYTSDDVRLSGFIEGGEADEDVKTYSTGKAVKVYIDVQDPSFALLEHPRRTLLSYYSFFEFLVGLFYLTASGWQLIYKVVGRFQRNEEAQEGHNDATEKYF